MATRGLPIRWPITILLGIVAILTLVSFLTLDSRASASNSVDGFVSEMLYANALGSNMVSPAIAGGGSSILFVSNRDGNQEIYVMDEDGVETTRLTFNTSLIPS